MGEWWDFHFSVELEDPDVRHSLMERIALLICDGDESRDVDKHKCVRQWVGTAKPSPDMDDDEDEETGALAAEVELVD